MRPRRLLAASCSLAGPRPRCQVHAPHALLRAPRSQRCAVWVGVPASALHALTHDTDLC